MLAFLRSIRKRLFGLAGKTRAIRREQEVFRRWSRRSIEDRFSL